MAKNAHSDSNVFPIYCTLAGMFDHLGTVVHLRNQWMSSFVQPWAHADPTLSHHTSAKGFPLDRCGLCPCAGRWDHLQVTVFYVHTASHCRQILYSTVEE